MTTKAECQSSWSRRCSTETIFSLQGKETDVVHDTSDSDSRDDGEWEPVDLEDEPDAMSESSGVTDAEIIKTKVIEVSVADDGDLQLADSELTAGSDSDLDSELDFKDYWQCARCGADNNNPLYRYCESCFKVRKNLFPPRPKRKTRLETLKVPRTLSQDSGFQSQELSQGQSQELRQSPGPSSDSVGQIKPRPLYKRRADSADRRNKRIKANYSESDTELSSDCDSVDKNKIRIPVASLTKTISDPSLSIEHFVVKAKNDGIRDSLDFNKNAIDKVSETKVSSEERPQASSKDLVCKEVISKEIVSKNVGLAKESFSNQENKNLNSKVENEKVANVESEKVESKEIESKVKEDLCIVCCVEPKSGVFVHGRIAHICCCYRCAVKVWAKAKRCPVCNCKVSNVLKAVIM